MLSLLDLYLLEYGDSLTSMCMAVCFMEVLISWRMPCVSHLRTSFGSRNVTS